MYLGLGVYLEMPVDDAVVYIRKRRDMLEQRRSLLIQKASHIKANIRLLYEVRRGERRLLSGFQSD